LTPHVVVAWYRALRSLPSFPTRRSSDLLARQDRVLALVLEVAAVPWFARKVDAAAERDVVALVSQLAADQRAIVVSELPVPARGDRKSTRLNSSHDQISYAVFCLKKKTT